MNDSKATYREALAEFASEIGFRFAGWSAFDKPTPKGVSDAEMILQKAVDLGLVSWCGKVEAKP